MPSSRPARSWSSATISRIPHSSIELKEKENQILLASADEFKLKAVVDILEQKLVKRKVPLKGLNYGVITPVRRLDRAPGDYFAAGHPDRKSPRNRESDQGQ